MPICLLEVGIPKSCQEDFSRFLTFRREVVSFQKANNNFLISASSKGEDGVANFIKSIKEVYETANLKQIPFCRRICRDGTNCLNRAKYGGYCWKHAGFEKKTESES